MSITLDTLRTEKKAAIVEAGAKYGARNIRVFGSVARGESSAPSDVDFLVDLDKGRTLYDLAGFVADVSDLLGVQVDAVTPAGHRYIRERVLSEGFLCRNGIARSFGLPAAYSGLLYSD